MNKIVNILLIEDHEDDLVLFKDSLLKLPDDLYCFYHTSNGLEGYSFLLSEYTPKIDLIFLDDNMPRMSGFEFLIRIKNIDNWWKGYPLVVMLTGNNYSEEERMELYEHGVASIVSKDRYSHDFEHVLNYWIHCVEFI